MTKVTLNGLEKRFGKVEVIRGVDLEIEDGEFVVFVGPSGCGKSTLLRMISGLEDITAGSLYIGDRLMNDVQAAKRGVAMVFQSYALYPHLTVSENIGFGLKVRKVPVEERERRVAEAAATLKLEALLERYPRELSGGQRQRVAIGRAIVGHPEVFLFDEPLSNLDAELRVHMRSEIAALHKRLGNTMIYVTHDQIEAMTLADKIVVLRDGRIEQVGTPRELYSRPANIFVAQFIGSPKMNVIPVGSTGRAAAIASTGAGTHSVGMRPEHLSVVAPGKGLLRGKVLISEYTGASTLLHVELDSGETCLVVHDGEAPEADAEVGLAIEPENLHFFDAEGRAIRRVQQAAAPAAVQ
jgi:multiple sugar transport system ATP-binding protein